MNTHLENIGKRKGNLTVERLLQIEYKNHFKTCEKYESDLKTERSRNGSEYQATYDRFVESVYTFYFELPELGPPNVNDQVQYIDQLYEKSMGVASHSHHYIIYLFELFGVTQENKSIYHFLRGF